MRRAEGEEDGEEGGEKGGPGIYEVVVEVGWKTRERGLRQGVTSSHSRKTRRSSENVAPCGRPDFRYGKRGPGLGKA